MHPVCRRPEEGVGSSRAGITGSGLCDVGARRELNWGLWMSGKCSLCPRTTSSAVLPFSVTLPCVNGALAQEVQRKLVVEVGPSWGPSVLRGTDCCGTTKCIFLDRDGYK